MGEIYPAWVTTERTRRRAGNTSNRIRYAWTGTSEADTGATPGEHRLHKDEGFSRRSAEDMHNWALDHGLESELMEHRQKWRIGPVGWTARVRPPGAIEPVFFHEEVGVPPRAGIWKLR